MKGLYAPVLLLFSLTFGTGMLNAQCPSGNVIYVDDSATGLNNGSSWSNAFTDLQDALVANCPGVNQIWVAAGTYKPSEKGGTFADRDVSFWLRNNKAIYGGFAGDETSLDQRDWKTNVTFLSGDLSGNDGPDFANYDDNAYHVINASGTNASARLDGFTITRGNADVSGQFYTNSGGGIYNITGSPTLANLRIVGNKAGGSAGGMYNAGAPTLRNVIISGNRAGMEGGGMFNSGGEPVLINVVFSGNRAGTTNGRGGGIFNFGASDEAGILTLINVTLTGNRAGNDGGGIYNGFNGTVSLTNVIIWDNRANNSSTSPSASIFHAEVSKAGNNSITYSLIANSGGSGSGWNEDMGQDSGGNMDTDPRLSNTAHPVLLSGSPVVNAGTNVPFGDGGAAEGVTTDPDGNSRITAETVDMGAYESPFTPVGPGAGGILYVNIDVNTSASDYTGSGNSWENALPQLYDALQWAQDNWNSEEGTLQIWVAKGTYSPTGGSREATFRLKSGVAVYGGFAGTETNLDERNPATNLTVLSGDLNRDDDEEFENNGDNSYHVVTGSGTDATARLDGFTISGGNADNHTSGNISGGGMYSISGSPALVNILFQGNHAVEDGGAMYNYGGGATLINVVFSGNSAGADGGAVYNDTSDPSLINVTLSGNSAGEDGGAIYNVQSSPILTNVIIWNNSADGDTGTSSSSVYNVFPSKAEISYSLIANSGGSGEDWNTSIGNDDGNNIDADPRFVTSVDPTTAPEGGGELSLLSGSPAANTGTLAPFGTGEPANGVVTDLGGSPRIGHEIVDMGPYESSFAPIGPGEGNVLYVDKDVDLTATDYDGSGNSWVNALPQLSEALMWVRDHWNGGEGTLQIWVAAGTYLPDAADRSASFILSSHVAVYGGFTGDETSLDQRDWVANPTILSGDLSDNDVSSPDSHYENSFHVVLASEVDETARLDGFTISGGYASQNFTVLNGGGMVNEFASPVLVNLHFAGNYAKVDGGGMYNRDESHPTLINVTFSGNSAGYSGGGMCNIEESHAALINVTFSGNSAGVDGGAIFNFFSNPTLTNVIIWDNSAGFGADASTSSPEASIVNADESTPSVSHSLIANSGGSGVDWISEIGQDNGGNIDEDPLFAVPVDPADAPTLGGDLHIQLGSPAGNTGTNVPFNTDGLAEGVVTDLEGNPRILHEVVDMGAYENPLIPIAPGEGNILYVNIGIDTEAPGYNGSGNSWSNALPQLYDALDWAHANWDGSDGALQIWVAGGTYLPTAGNSRFASFVMKNNVALYGGFAGTETALDERDWVANPTILSGDLLGNDGDDFENNNENVYHVVIGSGTDTSARLDGFTVSGGSARDIDLNVGGGMFNENGSPMLVNVSFSGNSSDLDVRGKKGRGAGMGNIGGSAPTLINVSFSGNSTVTGDGGGMFNGGESAPTLINVTFSGNSAFGGGGGGMLNRDNSAPILINVRFSDNSAVVGGGMYNFDSSAPDLINVTFSGNSAQKGGGMYSSGNSAPELTNVAFSGNSASEYGGAMSNREGSTSTLTNVIIWNNQAAGSTGSVSASIFREHPANVLISNSLIANSSGSGDDWVASMGTDEGGNLDINPRFAVPVNPADAPTTEGDLSLLSGSPAINAGKNEPFNPGGPAEEVDTDLNGEPRIVHGIVDMGAFESPYPPVGPDANNILYVNIGVDVTAAEYDGSGSSWANALPQLYDALAWAHANWSAADGALQIWVAEGTYKPVTPVDAGNVTQQERETAFELVNNVALYGGFAGTETSLDERDWVANPTILSGDIGMPDDLSDNSYHVIFNNDNGVSDLAVLDGFTITGGNADADTSPHNNGGGMFNSHVSPTINNCVFAGNASKAGGGGIYNTFESAPTLVNCLLSGNAGPTLSNGGGMLNNNSHPRLINCTIAGNMAHFGGAMSNLGTSNPVITNSIIYGNTDLDGNSNGISSTAASSPVFSYSLVQGLPAAGTGNLGDIDPQFANPIPATSAPTLEGDYSLRVNSPAIGMGDNVSLPEGIFKDLAGSDRITHGVVDMGAFESHFRPRGPSDDNIFYVDINVDMTTAAYDGSGSSWATALPQLSEALAWAAAEWDGARGTLQIWVAAGTYLPQTDAAAPRTATFQLQNKVAIYGGFDASESSLDERNFALNPTILSGDLADNDLNNFNNYDDNVYHVVTGSGTNASARLDGFKIFGGNANDDDYPNNRGGGMINVTGSPTVANVRFWNNRAIDGGGLSNYSSSSPKLVNVDFSGNMALGNGGGMFNISNCSPTLINVIFSGNNAVENGGGMYNGYTGLPTLINASFSGNNAGADGGGIYNLQYGIPTLKNVIIWNNSAGGSSTSISASIYNDNTANSFISHSLIANSRDGGNWIEDIGEDRGNNIDSDPLFTSSTDPADAPMAGGNLRILSGSPAINAGDQAPFSPGGAAEGIYSDPDGKSRTQMGRVDMGAYESPFISIQPGPDNILYVNINVDATTPGYDFSGSSWADALPQLSEALDWAANEWDVTKGVLQIWVAEGTYHPVIPVDAEHVTPAERQTSFVMQNNVAIYGGFSGAETALGQRDYAANPTILSGNIGNPGDRSDNSYHLVFNNDNGLDNTALLDGFILIEGHADAGSSPHNAGGGMFNSNVSPLVVNCVFSGNTANAGGGGMYNTFDAQPIIVNCVFSGNAASGPTAVGGGMRNRNCIPRIINCTFAGNQAASGGGMSNEGTAAPVIINSILYGNSSSIANMDTADPVISYSLVQELSGTDNGNLDGTTANPMFVGPEPASSAPTMAGDYSLQPGSAVINVGQNSSLPAGIGTDLAGNIRISKAVIDMGAYESPEVLVPGAGDILYVTTEGAGNESGESWDNAYPGLAGALIWTSNEWDPTDGLLQVWVAAGTYQSVIPADAANVTGEERQVSFAMANNVAIYGGFAGSETALSDRDWHANTTILSGDIGVPGDNSDNSYHVIFNNKNALDSTALLDGFTITQGHANHSTNTDYAGGGGIRNVESNPTIANCIFTKNKAVDGAGFYNLDASPTVINCSFSENGATNRGGGICSFRSAPALINCSFLGNAALLGGGAYNSHDSAPSIINCTFSGNNATANGGGGIYNVQDAALTIVNSIIWGNSSGIINATGGTSTASYSIIQGWHPGLGNMNIDPLFISQPDIGLGSAGDLRLQNCSPALNAGNNAVLPSDVTTDLDGEPRLALTNVDMGAYENQEIASLPGHIIYVKQDASGTGDGSSWENAYTDLQTALTSACYRFTEMWVAAGVYRPTSGTDRAISFAMRSNLAIYGGFTGAETTRAERDWVANPTILSGDIGTPGDNTDNSYHVIHNSISGLTNTAILDGFIITGGNASSGASPHNTGGGMFNSHVSPSIVNCIFSGNSSLVGGGGMYSTYDSRPVLVNCVFSGNSATGATATGGGMRNRNCYPIVINCTFSGNQAASGGGISNEGYAEPVITNSIIYGNSSGIANKDAANPVIIYSLVQGLSGTDNGNLEGVTDPMFVDPEPVASAPTTAGDYSLLPGSPAINAGHNDSIPAGITTDLAGNMRISESTTDMGAYETQVPCPEIIIAQQPANLAVCGGSNASFTIEASGGDLTYQWQISTDGGSTYSNLENNAIYAGVTTANLSIAPATSGLGGQYRCLTGNGCSILQSAAATLSVTELVITGTPPAGKVGVEYNFTFGISGGSAPYAWSLASGELPAGMTLEGETGILSGTPLNAQDVAFSLQVQNDAGCTAMENFTLNIDPGEAPVITFSAPDAATYGDADFDPEATSSNDQDVVYTSSNETVALITAGGLIHIVGAGTTQITADLPPDDDYEDVTAVTHELIVNLAVLTVTAEDKARQFGEENPPFTFIYEGFVDGEDESDLTSLPVAETIADETSLPDGYPITVGGATSTNYEITYQAGTLTVLPAGSTLVFEPLPEKTYGDDAFGPGGFSGDHREVNYISSNTAVAEITGEGLIRITGAGTTEITASLPHEPGHADADPITHELIVLPATLIVTTEDKMRKFGETNPAFTFSYSGFVAGEDESNLDTPPSASTTATVASPPDTYPITSSGAVSANYKVTYVVGTLTVLKAARSLAFDPLPEKTYGDVDFDPGAVASDGQDVVYTSTDETVAVITASGLIQIVGAGTTQVTAGLLEDPNYEDVIPVTRELRVHPATLTLTASDDAKTYDGTTYSGGNGVIVTGWQYGDTNALLEGTLTYSGTSQTAVEVGEYTIIPGGYEPPGNYELVYKSGILTIVPAGEVVIIFPQPAPVTYGDADFDPGATSSNDQEVQYTSSNEAVAVITAERKIRITGAGIAEITASLPKIHGDAFPVTKQLTVNPATLTITAENDVKTYDGIPYSGGNGVSISGWQYTDTNALLEGILSYAGATGAVNAGAYDIVPSGYEELDNYLIDYLPGTLLIEKAPLLITAEDKARQFGKENPPFTFVYEGFFDGEDETDLTSLPVAKTIAEETSLPDDYSITVSGAASANYEITYQAGTLTVLPAGSMFVFEPLPEKTYGDVPFDPGAISGDDREVVYSSSNPAVAAITTDGQIQILGAGTANITASLPDETGYENAEPIVQELVVNRVVLIITANNDSKTYDGTSYSGGNGVVITGWKYDDTDALLEGTLSYSGNSQAASNVGAYEIIPAGYGALNNYIFDYISGTLSITKALVTGVTVSHGSFVYDGTAKSLAISGDLPDGTSVSYANNGRTDVGTQEVTATISGDNYEMLVLTADLTITEAAITGITFSDGSFVYDGTAKSLAITGGLPSGASVSYTNNSRTDVGTQEVTATISGDNYEMLVLTADLTVLPNERSIIFPVIANKVYGDDGFNLGASSSSGETISYTSSNTAVALVSPAGELTITGAGTATITATVPENDNYANRPSISRTLVVAKAPQTISFAEIGEVERDAGMVSLDVSASSGLPVTLSSSDEQVAIVAEGNQLDILRLGTSMITGMQPGNANYLPADPVSRELHVVDPAGSLIKVHPAVSPNGDGINEFLLVEGIRDYPVNRMTVVNRNGVKVFQIENYDNSERVFRGLINNSFSDDSLLPQGTYFYLLEIKVGNGWKRKTGWFVIKYSTN